MGTSRLRTPSGARLFVAGPRRRPGRAMATPKKFGIPKKVSRACRKFFAQGIAMVNPAWPAYSRARRSASASPSRSPSSPPQPQAAARSWHARPPGIRPALRAPAAPCPTPPALSRAPSRDGRALFSLAATSLRRSAARCFGSRSNAAAALRTFLVAELRR